MLKICKICGKEFTPNDSRQKCCSPDCFMLAYRAYQKDYREKHRGKVAQQKVERKSEGNKLCPVCGREFTPNRPQAVFCSKECSRLANCAKSNKHAQQEIIAKKKRNAAQKSLDKWIEEARLCGLDYGNYRCQIEHFGKTFEELKK